MKRGLLILTAVAAGALTAPAMAQQTWVIGTNANRSMSVNTGAALVGYFARSPDPVSRLVLAVAGAACLVPAVLVPIDDAGALITASQWVHVAGVALGILLLGREHLSMRKLQPAAAE